MVWARGLSVKSTLERQQGNAFVWLVAAFAGGIALYFGLGFEPSVGISLIGGVLSGMTILYWWKRRDVRFIAFVAACLLFCFFAGMGAAQLRSHIVHTPMLVKKTGPVMVEGTVARIDMMGEGADMRLVLRDPVIEDIAPEDTPRNIRLRVRKGEGMEPGQRIGGLASLNPPSPPVAPGAFDFQRQAYFDSIGAVGFFYRTPEIMTQAPRNNFAQMIEGWRMTIAARVSEQFNQPQAGLIIALMTGQQRAVAEEDYQAMRDSGLAHLLAISGMNVAMIATSLFFVSRLLMAAVPWFALRFPIKKYAAVIAFAGAFIYTMVAGMNVPTQRAIIMTGIVLLAICLDRSPISLRLFAFSALMVLLVTPENIMGVSFQMSFAAVMALIVFYEHTRGFWTATYSRAGFVRKSSLYMIGIAITTLIGGTVTGIYSLYHFQTYPLYTLMANLIVVPLSGIVIMPCAVAAMALMPLGLEHWALEGMAWGVTWMLATARYVAGLEGAVLRVEAFPLWVFTGITFGFLWLMLWEGKSRFIGAAVMVVFLCLIPLARSPDVLVNEDAKLMAVKAMQGHLMFSSGRGDSYAAETWRRRNAEVAEGKRPVWPKEGAMDDLRCDAFACRMERNGQRVSFMRSLRAVDEECLWADVIVAGFPIDKKRCTAPHVIDRFTVWRGGAQALYLDSDGYRIETVEKERGLRPWTQTAANKKKH